MRLFAGIIRSGYTAEGSAEKCHAAGVCWQFSGGRRDNSADVHTPLLHATTNPTSERLFLPICFVSWSLNRFGSLHSKGEFKCNTCAPNPIIAILFIRFLLYSPLHFQKQKRIDELHSQCTIEPLF